jgi:hypothetical protein
MATSIIFISPTPSTEQSILLGGYLNLILGLQRVDLFHYIRILFDCFSGGVALRSTALNVSKGPHRGKGGMPKSNLFAIWLLTKPGR